MPAGDDFYYELDEQNRLLSVSRSWCQFAADNSAPDLADPAAMTGQVIWTFIDGEEARHVYGLIFRRVRDSGTTVEIPFRCDSPSKRRFMRLRVQPLEKGKLALKSWIEREEERDHVSLLDASVDRTDVQLSICAWCKRVDVDGEWLEVEDAVRRLGLLASASLPQLTHSICRPCEEPWRDSAT